jgi:hypothetical protein
METSGFPLNITPNKQTTTNRVVVAKVKNDAKYLQLRFKAKKKKK